MTRLIAAVLVLLGFAGAAGADTIKVVVPFAAGGPVDTLAADHVRHADAAEH